MPVIIALWSSSRVEMLLSIKKIGINQCGKGHAREKFLFQLGTYMCWKEITRNSLQLWYRALCSINCVLHRLICHTFPDSRLEVRPPCKASMMPINKKRQQTLCFNSL